MDTISDTVKLRARFSVEQLIRKRLGDPDKTALVFYSRDFPHAPDGLGKVTVELDFTSMTAVVEKRK